MRQFLIHSMELAKDIVFLTTINHYTTKARLRDMREHGFAIKEIYCIPTPSTFPQSGFQVAAVHTQKGWTGKIQMTIT